MDLTGKEIVLGVTGKVPRSSPVCVIQGQTFM